MKIIVTGGAGFIGGNFCHYMTNKYPEDTILCIPDGRSFLLCRIGLFFRRKALELYRQKRTMALCRKIHYKIIAALSCMVDRKPDRSNSVMVSELRWRSESSAYDDH